MKKLVKTFIYISLVTAPLTCAFAQTGAIEKILNNTDAVLAAGFLTAMQNMQPPTAPAPENIALEKASHTPAEEYLPIRRKVVYTYEYTSSDFQGSKVLTVEYLEYSEKDNSVKVTMATFNHNKPKLDTFVLSSTPAGIHALNSPLAGSRLEIPSPAAYNAAWDEGTDRSRIAGVNSKISVPAGSFTNCLKISTRLGGGDAGTAERYYAPGVGLLFEQILAEDKQETIKLISYQFK